MLVYAPPNRSPLPEIEWAFDVGADFKPFEDNDSPLPTIKSIVWTGKEGRPLYDSLFASFAALEIRDSPLLGLIRRRGGGILVDNIHRGRQGSTGVSRPRWHAEVPSTSLKRWKLT